MTAAQSSTGEGKVIATLEDLLAHARDMEAEAAERYDDLADQMEVHNNHEVARLFRKLAEMASTCPSSSPGSTPGRTRARRPPSPTRSTT
jgi:hypothetical protein